MQKSSNVHIIGIGGIGTSAVAKWFLHSGATVTGSDTHPSDIIQNLKLRGVDVQIGHATANVPEMCDLVVYSRAVSESNPERQVARERGITELSFAQFLGQLAKSYKTIAVSGTNGKSTTTAMIASILVEAGYDPSVIVGTQVPGWKDGNLRIGKGDWLVVEACEHMASMLEIIPNIAVITNIEEDHLDFYRDIDHIRETFQKWIDCKDKCANIVLNKTDAESQKLNAKYVDNFAVENRHTENGKQIFDVAGVEVMLKIPGEFNAENAAAALTVAHIAGVVDDVALKALAEFAGTWRRFEHVGEWHEASVYSDYAHHPTAVMGSIEAFREFFPDRRLVIVYEPHQHSRTHELFDDFVSAFDGADVLILSEIYEVTGRTEKHFESSADLTEAINSRGKISKVLYAANHVEAESHLRDVVEAGDVIVIMGAGSIDAVARKIAG
ncbi:MAG: UDP-N-acetylmuramate--L-alanine ligase [Candidatus Uhrbacteria bacterium]|nr:UDP-N-acetylmuramate--L-alanine ligase [Candidatus Uhrbacteria bacterium]